jgi:hypothetical protein
MSAALTLELYPAQVAAVASYLRANPAVARGYGLAPVETDVSGNRADTCTYHLGSKPTKGRGYDDRLTVRLGLSRTTIMQALGHWRTYGGNRGGLRHLQVGAKYLVSEEACREWLGDSSK